MGTVADVFVVPVTDKFLLYAPRHKLTALVNGHARQQLQQELLDPIGKLNSAVQPLFDRLQIPPVPSPPVKSGPFNKPLFLGILPTRNCNMRCRYCDFARPNSNNPSMTLSLARTAVNAYLKLLSESGQRRGEIHFFGGEPFYAAEVVHFVVEYAAMRAIQEGLTLHFEAITNGLYSQSRCQWIADHFDTVILSLDGPADIQNSYRPGRNGRFTFNTVARNARILSEGTAELVIRTCVTSQTVSRMPEIARWIGREFRPSAVCFENLTPSTLAEAAGIMPPDPFDFARHFIGAADILEPLGINTVLSTADLSASRATFCPVGRDALIVSPDGVVNACYLLEETWQAEGLDMRLGWLNVSDERFEIEPAALARVRQLNVYNKPLCDHCFCRYHCAGGCHVNHRANGPLGHYDDLCLQTRLVTLGTLLRQLAQHDLLAEWLDDPAALSASAWQPDDRLVVEEVMV
jgi:uncharacterized protein